MVATPLSLLLIDDDAELCSMMKEFFNEIGHELSCAYNGRDGLQTALHKTFDLVILDVMLPVVQGFTVLQQLRTRKDVPIILLTARGRREERISGLDAGADDYLPKPFDPDELFARIRAVLRRSKRHCDESFLSFPDLQIDFYSKQVWSAGRVLDLTTLEFQLLEMLVKADGRVLPRDEIMAVLFEREASPFDRSLDVHVSHLRSKLSRGHAQIRTVRGIGYLFTPGPELSR